MTELLIKVDPRFAREFKKISRELFDGNDSRAFQEAVQLLNLLRSGDNFERFWEIAERVRKKVHKEGGISQKEIDQLIAQSRERRRNNPI